MKGSIIFFFVLVELLCFVSAALPCSSDQECVVALANGSICLQGFCSNPYYNQGCIRSHLPSWHKIRVCGSVDPPEAEKNGHCRPSPMDYMEIRALAQDWDSSIFSTWILQILLSEILDVPTSVESSTFGLTSDFYNQKGTIDYGPPAHDFSELTKASDVIDCRQIESNGSNQTYQPCAHVAMEVWLADLGGSEVQGIEPPTDLGALASTRWWVPKFTAARDPSLTNYLGLMGEKNRRKLAETFKRPTTWKAYCEEVSENNCSIDDGVTARAPSPDEEDRIFVEGLYTGHFRATKENDCDDVNGSLCTGHIADYPCAWKSFVIQQAHHLDIALTSSGSSSNGGYSYSQLNEIWQAANATKSDVMMLWWSPEALVDRFLGTDAEFTPVVLPPPTRDCIAARVELSCDSDREQLRGESEGSCDYPTQALKKFIALGVRESSTNPELPEALWSPAYDAIVNLQMTNFQYGEIWKNLFELSSIDNNFNLRQATCQWFVDNIDLMKDFIPNSFPRKVEMEDLRGNSLATSAVSLSGIAGVFVLCLCVLVYLKRKTKVMYYAQVEFLCLLLGGSLLVTVGGLMSAAPPSSGTCIANVWLTNLGYCLQLFPLAQRAFAINKLANTGKQMRRIRLRATRLYRETLIAVVFVGGFLTAWTVLDAPSLDQHYDFAGRTDEAGETVVIMTDLCASSSRFWIIGSLSWQALILFLALTVAGVASRANGDMNDTKLVVATLLVHLVFLVLRAAVRLIWGEDDVAVSMGVGVTILLSLDTILSSAVYFVPKLSKNSEEVDEEILPDLFLNTTIMIADIEGFTAWSSVREPIQVFKFLEALYEKFDVIADRHKIYKIESTADCYVGVSGIPEERSDHAVVMAGFANDCMRKVDTLSKKLEMQFGPDTGDLTLRIALHSGPVTGGFMNGSQRFQLFGDTMTTAGLIHKSGESKRIHVSEATANLLIQGGKRFWVEERPDKIVTAEKGELKTFWLNRHRKGANHDEGGRSLADTNTSEDEDEFCGLDSQYRWIEWNTEILRVLLTKIIRRRRDEKTGSGEVKTIAVDTLDGMPLDEVQEIIELPAFDRDAARREREREDRAVPKEVVDQLRSYVTEVASMYEDNPFHNFAHASYVVMAVTKYMNRINSAHEIDVGFDSERHRSSTHAVLHDHTYGITSDPLTQFACAFSALIHDVKHPGVPNETLIKEDARLAQVYKGRSVAEQRSFDIAWDLLMESEYDNLRSIICQNRSELKRFRQLVVNCLMATDLGDKELKTLRNGRWKKAFSEQASNSGEGNSRLGLNRKATIVIEHLIQAADVAHTCQHWSIYRKWNQRLFDECYAAYRIGRAEKNPADSWYEGELGFFDFYIIPLSQKLRDCGVFGPTSDENLNYAQNNRSMWEKEGRAIVAEMLERAEMAETEKELSLETETTECISSSV